MIVSQRKYAQNTSRTRMRYVLIPFGLHCVCQCKMEIRWTWWTTSLADELRSEIIANAGIEDPRKWEPCQYDMWQGFLAFTQITYRPTSIVITTATAYRFKWKLMLPLDLFVIRQSQKELSRESENGTRIINVFRRIANSSSLISCHLLGLWWMVLRKQGKKSCETCSIRQSQFRYEKAYSLPYNMTISKYLGRLLNEWRMAGCLIWSHCILSLANRKR